MAFNQSYNTAKPVMSTIETNKVLKNTYFLLAMTLAFSAVTAGISMALQLPYFMGLVFTLVSFGLLFVVNKKADTASGVFWVFAFTGLMGAGLGPLLNHYAQLPNENELESSGRHLQLIVLAEPKLRSFQIPLPLGTTKI